MIVNKENIMRIIAVEMVFLTICYLIGTVNATNYEDCNVYGNCKPLTTINTNINYSTVNVNNSDYLDGFDSSYFCINSTLANYLTPTSLNNYYNQSTNLFDGLVFNMPFDSGGTHTVDYAYRSDGINMGVNWSQFGGYNNKSYIIINLTGRIDINDNPYIRENANGGTLSFWMYPWGNTAGGKYEALVTKINFGSGLGGYACTLYNTKIACWVGTSAESDTTSTTLESALLNKWNHIVFIWNGTNQLLYVNGILEKTIAQPSGTFDSSPYKLTIGSANGGGYYFNGSLDDIMIFNRSLNQNEVTALYHLNQKEQVTDNNINPNYVLYSGAAQNVDLGNYNLSAKYLKEGTKPLESKYLTWAPYEPTGGQNSTLQGHFVMKNVFNQLNDGSFVALHFMEINNLMSGCKSKFDINLTSNIKDYYLGTSRIDVANLCDNDFEDYDINIPAGQTGSIFINLTAKNQYTPPYALIYSSGYLYISFYGVWVPNVANIKVQTLNMTDWRTEPACINVGNYYTIARCPIASLVWMHAINITITANSNVNASVSEIEYYLDRTTASDKMPMFTNYQDNIVYTKMTWKDSTNNPTVVIDPNGTIIAQQLVDLTPADSKTSIDAMTTIENMKVSGGELDHKTLSDFVKVNIPIYEEQCNNKLINGNIIQDCKKVLTGYQEGRSIGNQLTELINANQEMIKQIKQLQADNIKLKNCIKSSKTFDDMKSCI